MHIVIPYSYKLCTLYGPFSINFYGLFIALALVICMKLISRNPRYAQLHLQHAFIDIICIAIFAGIVGGRLLAVISSPESYTHITDFFAIWEGGFSAQGTILGVVIVAPSYIRKIKLPVLTVCDLFAIYAPLFQAIARLGCLFAGCCYGLPTKSLLSIIYTHPNTIAPHDMLMHPTQLYSSLFLFFIFLYMFFRAQYHTRYEGHLFLIYLMLASAERFIVDFWRADRIISLHSLLSFHQLVALFIFCVTLGMHFFLKHQKTKGNAYV